MQKSHSIGLTAGLLLIIVLATVGYGNATDNLKLPRGIRITSGGVKTHVHANVSDLRAEDFPALTNIHALFTVYFGGDGIDRGGATDEKLMALTRLRFTNLACVVFTDCPLVTDKGIEYLSQISSVTNLGLRGMSISDAACVTMATKMRLNGVYMPSCPNVTLNGLLKMAQSKAIDSLGFSVGPMNQNDLIQIISTSAPQLTRMDIDLDGSSEGRLDLPALRQAAKTKKITLYAVRGGHVTAL